MGEKNQINNLAKISQSILEKKRIAKIFYVDMVLRFSVKYFLAKQKGAQIFFMLLFFMRIYI